VGGAGQEEIGAEKEGPKDLAQEAETEEMKHVVAVAVATLGLSGCATAVNGFDERVQFASSPAGAEVTVAQLVRGKLDSPVAGSCATPCSLVLERDVTYQATFMKAGCYPVDLRLYPTYDSAFYFAVIPDFWTGGAYDVQPNPTSVKLVCSGA
jgi:hypothetical protein